MNAFDHQKLSLNIDGVYLTIPVLYRQGSLPPILFLHGFGSTKEDYADIQFYSTLKDHAFIAYDAPGCGQSYCSDPSKINIPFLVKVAKAVLEHFNIDTFHLSGHSMGGLTALYLAHDLPSQVLSFNNIEGNISPEDCFLSRQIKEYPANNPDIFFNQFIERTLHAPNYASALYSASLKCKVRADAVAGIFSSMVELSDNDALMDKFIQLPCKKQFMYGEQNRHLSYLNYISECGVRLAEIPYSGHFPMYSNPVHMWQSIETLIAS